jgi:tryptophan synthase alpha chain
MFDRLAERGEGALGTFVMLGDPENGADVLDELVVQGADMIEVGIPFSDPIADGPVIQAAAKRALAADVRVSDCFRIIAGFRDRHPRVPVGILTYANLVVSRADFMRDAAAAGTDSLLIADVPAIEAEPYVREMKEAGLQAVLIAAANTPDATLARIARQSSAYTYCVSRTGITGTHSTGEFDAGLVARLKALGAPPPVFGFGISTPDHVRKALQTGASGVICGSAIVDALSRRGNVSGLVGLLKSATQHDNGVERLGGAMIESPA